jgi:hypothetical protein
MATEIRVGMGNEREFVNMDELKEELDRVDVTYGDVIYAAFDVTADSVNTNHGVKNTSDIVSDETVAVMVSAPKSGGGMSTNVHIV